jgi:NAD(P)H-dependent flavin oxidoreductase YrpB (nitropropane dioxygenase family)
MSRLHTPLCRLLGIEHPVIQAGMGWDAEVVRAAEAAGRVELTTVPGGQVAGRLAAGDVRPAAEIVRALVADAAATPGEAGGHAE